MSSLVRAKLSQPKDELLVMFISLPMVPVSQGQREEKEIETGDRQMNRTRERGPQSVYLDTKTFLNVILELLS